MVKLSFRELRDSKLPGLRAFDNMAILIIKKDVKSNRYAESS